MTNNISENLLQLQALNGLQEFDDDDDEMLYDSYEDYDDEGYDDDDELWDDYEDDDDDDDDDEMFMDSDDDVENLEERKRRRRRRSWRSRSFKRPRYRRTRGKRLRSIRGSRSTTLKSSNGQKMRVRFGKNFATSTEVNNLIKDTEKKFAVAMKERKANHDQLSKQISKATRELDQKVSSLRSSVKKIEKNSQTSSLINMLMGPPKIETLTLTGDGLPSGLSGKEIKAQAGYEKQNTLLPLLLSGGLGGGSNDDTLMLALALSK